MVLRKCDFYYGSAKLDSFLKGGIETQAITELAGEFGSGKSQICYTLCITANTPLDRNGLGGNVIFIDTENTFRAERIFQIAELRGISEPDEVLRKIYVCKIYNTSHLEVIIQDLGKSIEEYKAKLIIVDSIIARHRAEFTGRGTLADRQQRLNIMLHKLNRLPKYITSRLSSKSKVNQMISPRTKMVYELQVET